MSDRIVEYLEGREDGATSEEVALEALQLRGAVGPVARQVVRAAVEGNGRVVEGPDGRWRIGSAGPRERALQNCRFVTFGIQRGNAGGPVGVAAVLTDFGRDDRTLDVVLPPESPEGCAKALAELEAFAEGAVPAGFRLSRSRSAVNDAARRTLGRPVVGDGLCLFRMARRLFPHRSFRTVDDVCDAAGLSHLADREPGDEAALQAEALMFLLEEYLQRDVTTVEAVSADQYPTLTGVSFDAYAFDAEDLDQIPEEPGVYVMRDRDGVVIYVGKSVNLRDRVRTYFRNQEDRADKTRRILARIWSVDVQTVGSELEALMLEARLIQTCSPEFNTQTEVHERRATYGGAKRFVLLLPNADPAYVTLFCVAEGRAIRKVEVRKDLADASAMWRSVDAYFGEDAPGPAEGADPEEQAARRILDSWLARNAGKVNLVDVAAAGDPANLRRVMEDHIRGADADGWEKVWRV